MRFFCEGAYFIRIEFKLIRDVPMVVKKYGLGGFENEETQKSKCS